MATNYTGVEFNEKLDAAINRAGGRLYLANLDRPALERFVREILKDIEEDLAAWHRHRLDDKVEESQYWNGYDQGMCDAVVAVRLWAQGAPR